MNWDNIRFFLAVARAGSLAGAARDMSVKHSTVLRRINQLENDMDIKLFNRLNSGYNLTDSGKRILDDAVSMESNAIKMSRELRGSDQTLSGTINFTLPADLRQILIPLIQQFSLQHPDIDLNIIIATEQKDLDSLECDVALRVSHNIDGHLIGRQVAHMCFAPFIATSLYSEEQQDMRHYPWIAWSLAQDDSRLYQWITDNCGKDATRLSINDVYAAKQLIVEGYAMSFLPKHMVAPRDKLYQFGHSGAEYSIPIWLVTHADYRGLQRIKCFMDYLSQALADIPELQLSAS